MSRKARAGGAAAGAGEAGKPLPAPAAASPPRLDAPLGQGRALQRMLAAARTLTMHHAVVIGGPAGSGKSTVARWLAAALLCPSELDREAPCAQCRSCRKVASGAHPDLHVLAPAPERREIAVDDVRALLAALLHQPVEGRARVVLVDPASALNLEGQNALLKTLEEPGSATFLLLPTSRPEALLPTVRSRCERLGLRRLDPLLLRSELARRQPDRQRQHERAAVLARGSLGQALAMSTEQAVQLQDLVHELGARSSQLRPVATARAVLAGGDGPRGAAQRARTFLEHVRAFASERLHALAAEQRDSYVPRPYQAWTALLELALCAEQDLDLQIPPEQALVGLLVQWSRARGRA